MGTLRNILAGTRLSGQHLLLLIMVFAAVVVRIMFLNGRWINPDEGAHLMDGLLVLDGFVPVVDYSSRQVFYTYVLAFVLRVVGVSYEAARLYPVVASVVVGVLVFLIARRLFDSRVALLAAGIYLFLPFTIVFGTHVKTEPLTILLSCVGVYALLVGLDRKDGLIYFLLAGVSIGLAYYVRQSALALLLAAIVMLALVIRQRSALLRASMGVVGGFILVCVGFMGIYSTMLPTSRVLGTGALNPAAFVVNTVRPIWDVAAENGSAHGEESEEAAPATVAEAPSDTELSDERIDQPWAITLQNIVRTANLNSFLLVGLFLSPVVFWARRDGAVGKRGRNNLRAAAVLYAWLGAVTLAYAFYAVVRGFFPAYFGELLPPLAILAAVVALASLARLRPDQPLARRDIVVFGAMALGFVVLHTIIGPLAINRPLYYVAVPALLAVAYLGGRMQARRLGALAVVAALGVGTVFLARAMGGAVKPLLYVLLILSVFGVIFAAWRIDPRRDPARAAGFVSYSLLLSTFMLWLGASQAEIRRDFGGVWPPETVSEVVAYLEEHTEAGDEIISGAVMWEFEARRHPFMLLSHPLAFRPGMSPEQQLAIEQRLQEHPPAVIILDGYTEQTYGRNLPLFAEVLDTRYRLDRVVEGSRYPVQIFRLDAGARGPP